MYGSSETATLMSILKSQHCYARYNYVADMKLHCTNNLRDSWICFDQTFLRLELGNLFPARESLESDIPAGDGNTAKSFFLQCRQLHEITQLQLI